FTRCKLDFAEREEHPPLYELHKDLLRIRRQDPVISRQDRYALDGAVLGADAFLLRWFDPEAGDRLLVVNFGDEAELRPAPEPLLAPPEGRRWKLLWSSEDPRYGGFGIVDPHTDTGWIVPGESAVLLQSVSAH
ncbi:MAG: DUF3459 domain-containing protein, partial [Burkholderiales bacterium]|nr:DUF3459 domain-containing protein [Burkholderiales bacterium]